MSVAKPYAELVASNMLKRYGISAIWRLHIVAARTYSDGKPLAALSVIDIADAAERQWLSRQSAEH